MDIKEEVDETAGEVWQLLSRDGPQTLAQAKRKLDATSKGGFYGDSYIDAGHCKLP